MKLACPICSSKFTIAELMHEAAKDEMIDLAAKFGAHWGLVFDYTECFRSGQWGQVREQTRLRLLNDTAKLFEKLEFEYRGKRYRTTLRVIIEAMRQITLKGLFGFKNHNYLKSMLVPEGERLSLEGLTAGEERQREEDRRAGNREQRAESREQGAGMTGAEWKERQGVIGDLVDQVGSKVPDNSGKRVLSGPG